MTTNAPANAMDLAGLYREVDPLNIAEGEMLEELRTALSGGVKRLSEHWERRKSRKGELEILLRIRVGANKDAEEFVAIGYQVHTKLPVATHKTLAKLAGGRIIAQPSGTTAQDPTQIQLFDGLGNVVRVVDPKTGETRRPQDIEAEASGVAGRLGSGGAA